jgi:hypothetical protein
MFQSRYSKLLSVYVCAVVAFTLSVPYKLDAAPLYTVSPLVIDVEATGRDIITRTITLENTGSAPVTLYPSVNNISLTEGGTIQDFVPAAMSDRTQSLAAWTELSRAGIDLAPGEKTTREVTFRIVPDPRPGTYHALLGFGHGDNRDEAERQVRLGQAPGVIVTVTIADTKRSVLKLSGFIIDRFVTGLNNQAATYNFKNPGDTPLVPTGDILIYNNRGAEVASIAVNPDQISIPPGAEHQFTIDVPTENLFGKYKAYLDVRYGEMSASIQDTAFFYVLPVKLLLLLFAVSAIACVIIALLIHKRYVGDDSDIDPSGAEYVPVILRSNTRDQCEHDIDLKSSQS